MPPPPAADGGAGSSRDGITPLIDQALAIFGSYEITITPAATSGSGTLNSDKIRYLAAKDRDFLAITPQLQQAAEAGMSEALQALFSEGLSLALAVPMLGEAVLDHIVGRFEHTSPSGPPDVSMQPLAPSTIARKTGIAVRSAIAKSEAALGRGIRYGGARTQRRLTRQHMNANIGIDTGDLARGFADARVTTRKVG